MKKDILAVVISVGVISGAIFLAGVTDNGSADLTGSSQEEVEVDEEMSSLIDCLAEEDLVIYGAEWCPACTQLAESLGGYDAIDPIYVECAEGTEEEARRCQEETQTTYVPEIQIDGELYEGPNDPQSLANEVGCEL